MASVVILSVAITLSGVLDGAALAAGNLMVTPTRIVFGERDRTAQVTLVNQGTETGDFRISFLRQDMTETGEFVALDDNAEGLFSDPMIRFSPRQVKLPPGQSQVVRLMLRKPNGLADGEYRSHMLFQALPTPTASSVENIASSGNDGNITIELIPIVGVSIPVIVRHGALDSQVDLANARIIDAGGSPRLSIDILRTGTGSAYGDIRATFTPQGGGPLVVAQANSVAVYANLARRRFEMPLTLPAGLDLANGVLDIVFIKPDSDAENGTLASARLKLN